MAIAKTPKTTTAAVKPAASKTVTTKPALSAKPAPAKPAEAVKAPAAPKIAAAAKAPEEAVIHSAEVAAETTAQVAESVTSAAETTTAAAKTAASEVTEAIAKTPVAKATTAVVKQAKATTDEMLSRGVGPLLDFGRENAILFVATGNELALGLHKLSLSLLDWSAESCDKGVAASQAMLSAKSVEEVMDLSRSLANDGLQQILKESSALNAISTKILEETLVPLPGRFAATVEKLAAHAA